MSEIIHGDCLEIMDLFESNSFDACVTDPPYHLTTDKRGGTGVASLNLNSPAGRARVTTGFMGKAWDGGDVAFRPETWAQVLRVLKPGAHLVAFAGTRRAHRMVCAIEDAGFEIRDSLMWIYGQGFPKHENALKPAHEPICLARKPLSEKSVEANVRRWGTGAIRIDECTIEASGRPLREVHALREGVQYNPNALSGRVDQSLQSSKAVGVTNKGRWPANVIHDGSDEVVVEFPDSSGQQARARTDGVLQGNNIYGSLKHITKNPEPRGDQGSSARFFYCAKATKADRAYSKHPTVKPVALMRWLARLVTLPGGRILDPFAGSGTTGAAAEAEGFRSVLVEKEAEYYADIVKRLADSGRNSNPPLHGPETASLGSVVSYPLDDPDLRRRAAAS